MTTFFYVTIFLLICLNDSVTTKRRHRQRSAALTTNFKCVNGDRYQENKCNHCRCTNGMLVGCSRTTCDGLPFYDMAKDCEVGTKWKEECNSCQCAKQYGTVCTVKKCKVAATDALESLVLDYEMVAKKRIVKPKRNHARAGFVH